MVSSAMYGYESPLKPQSPEHTDMEYFIITYLSLSLGKFTADSDTCRVVADDSHPL